jgi:ATP-dependent DNA helicase PIF1
MSFNKYKKQNDMMDSFRGMLEEYEKKKGIDMKLVKLSESQESALSMFKDRKNLLVIGSGGSGKSFLIKEMQYWVGQSSERKHMVVTATTGIAAYNINGITINSFMGIGTGEQDVEVLIKKVNRKRGVRERIRMTDILVIDEISMASAELFEKINRVCQVVRRSRSFFGGLQVVLTGDFLQLLPVFLKDGQDTRLIFESDAFNAAFNRKHKNIINLTSNFRQNNTEFIEMLLRIRKGEQTEKDMSTLRERLDTEEEKDAVHLVSSNKHAQIINLTNLNSMAEQSITFKVRYEETGDAEICRELTKEIVSQFAQKGIEELSLKKNTRVMLIKNLSVEEGLVNGSVGTVVCFEKVDGVSQMPRVKFDNGIERIIMPTEWDVEMNDSKSTAIQVPLMLCWALTIHKSQSLTLEKAVLELGDCFCDHQVYVALSRVKTISGLYLRTFDERKIKVNEKVKTFMKDMKLL